MCLGDLSVGAEFVSIVMIKEIDCKFIQSHGYHLDHLSRLP